MRLLAPGGVGASGVALAHGDEALDAGATVRGGVGGVAGEGVAEHALLADTVHGAVGDLARGPGGLGGAAEVDTVVPGAGGHNSIAGHSGTASREGVNSTGGTVLDHIRGGPHGVEELGEVGNVLEHCSDKAHTRRQRQRAWIQARAPFPMPPAAHSLPRSLTLGSGAPPVCAPACVLGPTPVACPSPARRLTLMRRPHVAPAALCALSATPRRRARPMHTLRAGCHTFCV